MLRKFSMVDSPHRSFIILERHQNGKPIFLIQKSCKNMKCITWNVEWATESSNKGKLIKELIGNVDPDVICLTEATLGMVPKNGHLIESEPDYGYPNEGDRRKVLLWSKQPWQEVDSVGSDALPSGRFVSGITRDIRFVGVCIPWFNALVINGRKDRARWEDHLAYLNELNPLIDTYCNAGLPVCVTGDFNQRIPRARQPIRASQSLSNAFDGKFNIVTAGLVDEEGHQLIDHVATCGQLAAVVEKIIPKKSETGLRLSDHVGVITTITPIP